MAGLDCGSQVVLCEYPIHFDTYRGCSHLCKYCFAQRKQDLNDIQVSNCLITLRKFIDGKRNLTTNWCDWKIPLHWGGLSDPFQPVEKQKGVSLEALKILAETQYPFIVSTKGKLIAEEPYLTELKKCNAVVQISMVCSSYDKLEPGAPTFEERLEIVRKISPYVKRVIIRAQPYMTEVKDEFLKNIKRFKEAGAYGVTVEGMKFVKKKPGLIRVGGDFCYPEEKLKHHYEQIKQECHKNGLAFYCAENRLRPMGDSTACCGAGDLKGFEGNRFNCVNIINNEDVKPTEQMKKIGTAQCFKSIHQGAGINATFKKCSFCSQMILEAKSMQKTIKGNK